MQKVFSAAVSILLACSMRLDAQVPAIGDEPIFRRIARAQQWIEAGSFHVAQKELEDILPITAASDRRAEILFLLSQCAFEDQEYEHAYHWSNEFLLNFPHDLHESDGMYIRGVSAFQIGAVDTGIIDLTQFTTKFPEHPRRGSALFWRAMCELDKENWNAAEADLQQCFSDSSEHQHHDYARMGLALSYERRGEYNRAADELERLLDQFPNSEFTTDARIRLASVSLRMDNAKRGLEVLEIVEPKTRRQREEYLMLAAEANYRLSVYTNAQSRFKEFLLEFPESPNFRKARFDLAWSYLKQGETQAAQNEFDSLAVGNDSLATEALYQSAIIALLEMKNTLALNRLDSLVARSPYDPLADKAYFQMGMINYRVKKYRDARKYFQYVARLFPDSPLRIGAYRMSGESSIALNDFSNAQYSFAQARRLGARSDVLAASMFQEGVSLYHLGRFRSSADLFDDFLNQFSHDRLAGEAYVWRAEALYQDGRLDQAERSYALALRLFPDTPKRDEASYGLAWTLFEQKKFSQAASAFERYTTEFPESPHAIDAALRKADCYFFLGQYDKATALYASLSSAKSDGRTVEYAAFQLAMSYIQRGETDRGIEQLREFVNRFPNSIYDEVVQFNIAWTFFSNDKYAQAVTEFQTLVRQYPETQLMPRVMFNLGDAFYNLKQYDSARAYYQNVIQDFPASPLVPDAISGLQYAYEAEGRPAEAATAIEKFIVSNPSGAPQEELLLKKGDILFGQGDFAGALQEYQRLLSLKPAGSTKLKALYQLARTYEFENNPTRAGSYYQQILTDTSNSELKPTVSLAYGLLQIKQKQYNNAVDILREFDSHYAQSPTAPEAMYNLGIAFQSLNQKDSAWERFQSIVLLQPTDVFADRAHLQLARLHQSRKEYQAALDTLEGIVKRRNDDLAAEALLIMGDNFLLMKKYQDALQAFIDVIDQYTEFQVLVGRAHLGAGECYERLRDRKKAIVEYDEAVKSALDAAVKKEAQERLKRLKR